MLTIVIPEREYYDEDNNEFYVVRKQKLVLEHSLLSISKWESKWCKPFLNNTVKTNEEVIDYIRCMTITQNVDPLVYKNLTTSNLKEISDYIDSPMSASTFFQEKNNSDSQNIPKKKITSEYIYYWMAKFNIPFECEKWHLSRLINLLRICAIENDDRKMSKQETMLSNKELNALRRAKYKTRG